MKSLLVIIFLLSGCVSAANNQKSVPIKEEANEITHTAIVKEGLSVSSVKKHKIKVISIVNQEEIDSEVLLIKNVNLAPMMGRGFAAGAVASFIASLLDSINDARKQSAEESVALYRDMLINNATRKHIHDKYKQALKNISNYHVVEYIESTDSNDYSKYVTQLRRNKGQEKLLFLFTSYSLDYKFNSLYVVNKAILINKFKNSKQYSKKKFTAIYQSPSAKLYKKSLSDSEIEERYQNFLSEYAEKAANAKISDKSRIRRYAAVKARALKKKRYIEMNPPIHNMDWSEETLTKYLNKGFEYVIEDIVYALEQGIKLKKNQGKKTALPSFVTYPRKHVENISASLLGKESGISKYYLNFYLGNKYMYFTLPDNEVMKIPSSKQLR